MPFSGGDVPRPAYSPSRARSFWSLFRTPLSSSESHSFWFRLAARRLGSVGFALARRLGPVGQGIALRSSTLSATPETKHRQRSFPDDVEPAEHVLCRPIRRRPERSQQAR